MAGYSISVNRTLAAIGALVLALAAVQGPSAAGGLDLRVTETITGRGAAGPYPLSWTNIEQGSEWVWVDGKSLVPHLDYTLDAQTGTIAFARPLAAYQTARVTYFRTASSTRRQAGPPTITVTQQALRRGGSALSLTASYTEAGPSPAVSYGLKAKTGRAGGTALETTLLVSRRQQQGAYGPSAIGWRTAASTRLGALRLTGAIGRAEQGFADPASLGLSGAGQIATAQAEYAASGLSLTSSYTASQTGKSSAVVTSQRISYAPSAALNLTAARAEQRTGDQVSETDSLELTSRPGDRIDLRARYRESDADGRETATQAVETNIRPTSSITLGAGWVRQEGDASVQGQKASVAWTPSSRLQIEGEYVENPEDSSGRVQQATASRVGLRTRLGSLGLTASTWRKEETAGESQRHDLLLFMPLTTGSKLTVGYSIETSPSLASSLDRNTYRLGYSLIRGSDLALSLEGQWLNYRGAPEGLSLRSETRAEAKLFTRF